MKDIDVNNVFPKFYNNPNDFKEDMAVNVILKCYENDLK